MNRLLIPCHSSGAREKPRWQSSKWMKFAYFVAMIMLLGLHYELSIWDGLVEREDYSTEVTAEELTYYNKMWLEYGYNAWLANRLPLRRDVPDLRDDRCLDINYTLKNAQDTATLVIIFRNEQASMLLRTLYSIKDRTDPELIWSIVLIDDGSDMGIWKQKFSALAFEQYVRVHIFPTTKIYRMEEQMGLHRARRFAVRQTKNNVIVFLDAHVEVNYGWLEPLMDIIISNPKTLACPQLDLLHEQTLQYKRVLEQRGLFDWTLRRREVPLLWHQLKELPHPFETPVPHLSVFAVDGEFFNKLVHMDVDIESPAASELELSFQVWRSGNRIVQVPCSRVGHLEPSNLNYMQRYGNLSQLGKKHFKSYKRLLITWLNEPKYKELVYQYQPQIKQATVENIHDVLEVAKKVNFESFDWYLEHVASDLLKHFPLQPRIDLANGTLRPIQKPNQCLTGNFITGAITLEPCASSMDKSQNWTLTYMNDLRLGDTYCIEVLNNHGLTLNPCHDLGGHQSWHFHLDDNRLGSNSDYLQFDDRLNLTANSYDYTGSNQMWYFEDVNVEAMKLNDF